MSVSEFSGGHTVFGFVAGRNRCPCRCAVRFDSDLGDVVPHGNRRNVPQQVGKRAALLARPGNELVAQLVRNVDRDLSHDRGSMAENW